MAVADYPPASTTLRLGIAFCTTHIEAAVHGFQTIRDVRYKVSTDCASLDDMCLRSAHPPPGWTRCLPALQPRPPRADSSNGWKVSLLDGRGNTLLPAVTVAATTAGDTRRRRAVIECRGLEASEVQLQVAWATDEASPTAEIYEAAIEYVTAQSR